ncbi:unnamed protein product [Diamesa tonsa]
MAPLVLYHAPFSPFSRSVLLLIRYLKIDVDIKVLNLMEKEQFDPEFVKINPQHTVPTINDNGFSLWESRAILTYLMESRAPLTMPTSPKEKAVLNQRLYYELGVLTQKLTTIFSPIFTGVTTEISEKAITDLYDVFTVIDTYYFDNGNEWIAGESITVADFAYVATISTLLAMGATLDKYPRLSAWFERCKSTFPDYQEANGQGAQMLADFMKSKLTKGF